MHVNRPGRAIALFACLVSACGAGDTNSGPEVRPRNVLLISLDTLRPDHLGCYGSPRDTSPTIDALAARGVRFADASSAAPWTLPSHATLFTGLYPSRHGVKNNDYQLSAERVTLAEALAEHDFQTFAVLSALNLADPRVAILQGFATEHVHYVRELVRAGGEQRVLGNTAPEVIAAAEAFLAGRDPARPFFLFAHFYDAHTDFTPDPEYRARFVEPYDGRLDGSTAQLMRLRRKARLKPADLRFLAQLYDAEIRQLDDRLGAFLQRLEAQGLLTETLVVLLSDHGEEFHEHGGLLHGRTHYEELLRVPLILAGPGIPAGRVVHEPVGLVDLLPTVLARLGIVPPAGLDGLDLAPTWSGGTLASRAIFGEADHLDLVEGERRNDHRRSVRIGHEKLHLDLLDGSVELYDLAADPGEQRDLAPDAPERVAFLRAALTRFQEGARAGTRSDAALADEDLELLRALGYGGDDIDEEHR